MRIISRRRLAEFYDGKPRSASPLRHWYAVAKAAKWSNFSDLKATFASADQVKVKSGNTVTVINVGGNKYRMVCAVHYNRETIYVLRVMTHSDSDQDKWKEEL